MDISKIQGENAVEAFADIIVPLTNILGDKEIREEGETVSVASAVAKALKKYTKDVLTIMAVLDGENPKTYSPNIVQIPIKILELANMEEVQQLFMSFGQMNNSSGSAMENMQETETE